MSDFQEFAKSLARHEGLKKVSQGHSPIPDHRRFKTIGAFDYFETSDYRLLSIDDLRGNDEDDCRNCAAVAWLKKSLGNLSEDVSDYKTALAWLAWKPEA